MRYHLTPAECGVRHTKKTGIGKDVGKGNTLALLVGMQTGAGTLEGSMKFPQKVKNRTILQPSKCTTRSLPKEYKLLIQGDPCTPMFIEALSTIEYYSAIERMKSCHLQQHG